MTQKEYLEAAALLSLTLDLIYRAKETGDPVSWATAYLAAETALNTILECIGDARD